MWIRIFVYVLGFFKGSFGLFNAYLVLFGLFLPKTEEKNEHLVKLDIDKQDQ